MDQWNWLINQGIAVVVLAFIGVVVWRVLIGSAKTGYQGMLVKWAQGLSDRMGKHAEEQTDFGKQRAKEHRKELDALMLLVESQAPPVGAAFIAAKAVHKTAADIEQLRQSLLVSMKICRLVATQFPEVEQAIDGHCDEIEKIIGEA